MPERFLILEETFNTRDIGGYPTHDGRTLRYGRFFRSDSLHNLSPAGQAALSAAGIRTVIDLRRQDEVAADPNKLDGIADLAYFNLPILSVAASSPAADNPLREVRSMGDVYRAVLDHYQEPLRAVLCTIADRADTGVLVHCSAGKDRTGVVMALLMDFAGVPEDQIVADYMITKERLAPIVERLRHFALSAGLDMARHEQMLNILPEYMQGMLDHLHRQYGSAAAFFNQIGLTAEQRNKLQAALVESR
jgi:protein-tyrosine phosphatase